MSNIVIVGATSAIAQACAKRWISPANKLFLVARNESRVAQIAADFKVECDAEIACFIMDAKDVSRYPDMLREAEAFMGNVDTVLIAHGTLPDAIACEGDTKMSREAFEDNAVSVITMMAFFADYFRKCGKGKLAVISSVAGDRGRASNYLYGSAKAAVSTFAEGLDASFSAYPNVHMIVVKPGFVRTPMTQNLSLPPLLSASPEAVAKCIDKAIAKSKYIVYTPFFWRFIMMVVCALPRCVFRKMKM
jgi:short-subunit dehydrogenase